MRVIEGIHLARVALDRSGNRIALTETKDIEKVVRSIIDDVVLRGDDALLEYTRRFDSAVIENLEVTHRDINKARNSLDSSVINALEISAGRIRHYHQRQMDGVNMAIQHMNGQQQLNALKRVGIYIPGGRAIYPSTVVMTVIPAKVAKVAEIILVSPPSQEGKIPAATLVAADIAGADRIFAVGGAQAIAALAFGTKRIPGVDKICGPGNIYVATAKRIVSERVPIDAFQGPSEVMVIADELANPVFCATEILAQLEHDPEAQAVLVTTSEWLANEIQSTLKSCQNKLINPDKFNQLLEKQASLIIVDSLTEAFELAEIYAPEHLCLLIDNPRKYLKKIKNAGCVVFGSKATTVIGDYIDGPSHSLPTQGTARFNSPLSVIDFLKITSIIEVNEKKIKKLGPKTMTLARAEGLESHALAIEERLKNGL
jgi:histidinol dehydrogenase